MATPANTFTSYDAIGNREDLSDVIYNVDPYDTPFLTGVPRTKATAVLHEWQTDALAAASSANAVLEGDDATTTATIQNLIDPAADSPFEVRPRFDPEQRAGIVDPQYANCLKQSSERLLPMRDCLCAVKISPQLLQIRELPFQLVEMA